MRIALIFLFLLVPSVSLANLVPCDGPECQACHFVEMGQRILNFFVMIAVSIAVLMIAIGGLQMVVSGGNESKVNQAKGIMTNAIIGLVVVLAAWLIVDTIMKNFFRVPGAGYGGWNQIQCVTLPEGTGGWEDDTKPECSDGKDNDADGKIDGADPECIAGGTVESGATAACSDDAALIAKYSGSPVGAVASSLQTMVSCYRSDPA